MNHLGGKNLVMLTKLASPLSPHFYVQAPILIFLESTVP